MEYGITPPIFGGSGTIDIGETDYTSIKNAKLSLIEISLLEENLDLVTENFQEYEVELLRIASRNMFFSFVEESLDQARVIVIRRIINLLTACRMYLESEYPSYKRDFRGRF